MRPIDRTRLLNVSAIVVTFAVIVLLIYFSHGKKRLVEALLIFGSVTALMILGAIASQGLVWTIKKRFPFEKAYGKELEKEDDILLQATGLSQAVLFIYLSLIAETELVLAFKILIPTFAISFYTIRAYAKLKNRGNLRYVSMCFLGFIIGNSLASLSLPSTLTESIEIDLAINDVERFSIPVVVAVWGVISVSTFFFFQHLFENRYQERAGRSILVTGTKAKRELKQFEEKRK